MCWHQWLLAQLGCVICLLPELAQSHYPSFCGLFILFVLICQSFLYHILLFCACPPSPNHPSSQNLPVDRTARGGSGPSRELGFSSECFNEAAGGLPQIPAVGLLGTLPGLATTPGRWLFLSESRDKEQVGWGAADPGAGCWLWCDSESIHGF